MAFGFSHLAAVAAGVGAGAFCAQAAGAATDAEIATKRAKTLRIELLHPDRKLRDAVSIHCGFNLLSQRKSKKGRNYTTYAGNMVNGEGLAPPREPGVAAAGEPPYVRLCWRVLGSDMTDFAPVSPLSWPLVLIALVVAAMLAGTVGLWVYFGTAVFFEMVRNGFAACF